MIKRICPICDMPMEGSHYCRACRKWIKAPHVMEVNFYLNERHDFGEENCEYHGISSGGSGKAKSIQRSTPLPGVPLGRSTPLPGVPLGHAVSQPGVPKPRAPLPGISEHPQPAGGLDGRGRGRTSASGMSSVIWVIIIIIFLINFLLPLLNMAI